MSIYNYMFIILENYLNVQPDLTVNRLINIFAEFVPALQVNNNVLKVLNSAGNYWGETHMRSQSYKSGPHAYLYVSIILIRPPPIDISNG